MLVKEVNDVNDKYVINKLTALIKLYCFLIDTAQLVNQNYAIQLLPSITNQFGFALFAMFYSYWMVKLHFRNYYNM